MSKCVVCGAKYPNVILKAFPTDETRRKEWFQACDLIYRPTATVKNMRLCLAHFSDSQLELNRMDGRKLLKYNAIPDKFSKINQLPGKENDVFVTSKSNHKKQFERKVFSDITTSWNKLSIESPSKNDENITPSVPINCESNDNEIEINETDEIQIQNVNIGSAVSKAINNNLLPVTPLKNVITRNQKRKIQPEDINSKRRKINETEKNELSLQVVNLLTELLKSNERWSLKEKTLEKEISQLMETLRKEKAKSETLTNLLSRKYEFATTKLENKISELERELQRTTEEMLQLDKKLKKHDEVLSNLFSAEQVNYLFREKKTWKWTDKDIIDGLIWRYELGVDGYGHLKESGYPIPAYSTLTKHTKDFKIDFGVFENLFDQLKLVASQLPEKDRYCFISFDEMTIKSKNDFDKNSKQYYGYVTTDLENEIPVETESTENEAESGDSKELGTHLLVALARGITSPFKQMIGAHITSSKVTGPVIKSFVQRCVNLMESAGFTVVALGSDMGSNNKIMWKEFDCAVNRGGVRAINFRMNNHDIHFMPDPVHLLKNLKSAMLSHDLIVPQWFLDDNNLLSPIVRGKYVQDLWQAEIKKKKEVRSLHHLHYEDLYPDTFGKMRAGAAVRFFSIETASAIEDAIIDGILPRAAVTTARFIRYIYLWFKCIASRCRKTSITKKNRKEKFFLLRYIIQLFEDVIVNADHPYWKPLNTGMIMATAAFHNIAHFLLSRNDIYYVLGHRFTQDALENTFSRIRKKFGKSPTAKNCLYAIRTILLCNYARDLKRTNYLAEKDTNLLDLISLKKTTGNESDPFWATFTIITKPDVINFVNAYPEFDFKQLYYLTGCCVRYVRTKSCKNCLQLLREEDLKSTEVPTDFYTTYQELKNCGGLVYPPLTLFILILHIEAVYVSVKSHIIRNRSYTDLILKVEREVTIANELMKCCNIKRKCINHFLTIRNYAFVNFEKSKPKKDVYGSNSIKN